MSVGWAHDVAMAMGSPGRRVHESDHLWRFSDRALDGSYGVGGVLLA